MKRLLTFLFLLLGIVLLNKPVKAQNGVDKKIFMNLPDTVCMGSYVSMNVFLWNSTNADKADWTVTGGTYSVIYSTDAKKLIGQKPDPTYKKNALTLIFTQAGQYSVAAKLYVGSKTYDITKSIYVKDCSVIPCEGQNTGVGDFLEDFGKFDASNNQSRSSPYVPAPQTGTVNPALPDGYKYVQLPIGSDGDFEDNSYTIFSTTGFRSDWVSSPDHTPNLTDSLGGMLVANSAAAKKTFYIRKGVTVCPGSLYNFSAWFMNVNPLKVFNDVCASGNADGYHYAGVTFLITDDATGNEIARFKTYDVSMNLAGPTWQMFGGGFQTPAAVTSVTLSIVNDRFGGCGNDIAIDDISFKYCSPYIYSFIDGQEKPPLRMDSLCEGAPVTIKAIYSPASYFKDPTYQWQFTKDTLHWPANGATGNFPPGVVGLDSSVLTFPEGTLKGDPNQIVDYYFRVNIIEKGNPSNCASPSLFTKVTVLPKPKVTVSSGRICIGDSVLLTASGGYSAYEWQTSPIIKGPKMTASPLVTTTYSAIGIADYGWNSVKNEPRQCTDTGYAKVIVDLQPTIKATANPVNICLGNEITLNETHSGAPVDSISWRWQYNGTNIGNINDVTLNHTPADTGTKKYTVILDNHTCSAIDSVTVNVRSVPDADKDSIYRQCNTAVFNIKTTTPPADQQGKWLFDGTVKPGVTFTGSTTSAQTQVSGVAAGDTVHLFWIITNKALATCADTSRVTLINTRPLTPSKAGSDMVQCDTTKFQLNASRPGYGEKGKWTLGAATTAADVTLDNDTAYNAIATIIGGTRPKTVQLIWTISNGVCTNSNTTNINLTVKDAPSVNITAAPVCNTVDSFTVSFNNKKGTILNYVLDVAPTALPARKMSGFTQVSGKWPGTNAAGSFNVKLPANTPAGNYDFVITVNDTLIGCNKTIFFSLSVEKPSTAPTKVTASVDSICVTANTTLTVVGGTLGKDSTGKAATWKWYTGACPGAPGSKRVYPASSNADSSVVTFNNVTTTTTYFVLAESAGPCGSTTCVSVTVTVFPKPNIATVGNDQFHCDNDQFTLSGNTPAGFGAKGVWRYPAIYKSVITIADSTKANTTVTVPAGYSVPFTWWITNGVCDSTKATVTLTNYKQPAVATVGKDQIHCDNDQFTLSGNTAPELGAKGVWRYPAIYKGVITIADSTKGNTTVTVPAGNSVPFTWWVTNGVCDSTKATVTLTNYKQPAVATVGKDQIHCDNDQFTLSGNTAPELGAKGVWRYPAIYKGVITITDSTKGNTTVTVPAGNSVPFTWWVTNGVCDSTKATVTLTNYKQPAVATVGKDQIHCDNDQFTLSGNTAPELGAKGVWRYPAIYKGVISIVDSTKGNTTVTVPAGNSVPFTWWVTNGVCDSTKATVTLTNYKQPAIATVGKDQIHCDNDQFTLSGNTAPELGARGVWRYPAIYKGVITIADSTKGNTTVTVPAGNSVPFTWWVTNGVCDSTKATVTLTNYKQPAVATVGKDQIHCDNDQFTLSGNTAPELGAKGVWRYPAIYKGVITIADSTKGNTTVTVPAGNSVPFTWWVTNGVCDSTKATVTLTNYKQPAVATVGKDQIHCDNDQFTLSGNTAPELGAKGVWRYPAIYKGIITITDSTKGNTTVTVPAGNSVPFTWWITNGVCDSTKATVTLTNYKQPAVATVGKDQIHCDNDQFTLSGNTAPELGAKGVWRYPAIYKGVITIADSTKGNTTVTVPAGNSVPFTWWVTNGVCDSTKATVTLTNYKQPAVATVGKDQIHCDNDQFTLSGNTAPELGAKGVWRYPAIYKGVITIADSTKGNTTVTVPAGNSVPFTWWVTNGVCDSTKATVTLTNYKQPAVATVGKDQIHCNNDQFTLSGNTAPELGAKGVWRYPAIYKGVITITDSTKGNTTVTVPAGNSVPFTWWVTNGVCDSTKATVTLTNYKQPAVATVGKDQIHCDNDQFTLSGNTAPELGAKGVWRYPAIYKGVISIVDSTKGNTTVTVPAGNSVPFTWWVTNGVCDSTKATVTLTNYKQPAVATVGKDQIHCDNDQFTLSGNTAPELGAKGVWRYPAIYKGVITITDSTKGNTTVTVPAGNSVPFTWWVTNGVCDSTKATVTLTNYKQPAVATVGKDQIHCDNDQFTLSGNTAPELGAKGVWRYPAIYKGVITITDSTKGNTTVTVPAGNSVPFTWWVTNGVCDSTKATVTLTNYKQPAVATVGKDQFHCDNDQFTLSGNTAPELGAKGVWRYPAIYKGVITITDSTKGNTTVTVPAGNSVPFTWWVTNGVCDSTKATVTLTNYKQPAVATVGKDQIHCNNDQFTLSGNTAPELGAKGVWRYPAIYKGVITIADSTKGNTTVTVPAGNSIPFTWWVTNGVCDSTKATVTLTNYKQPAVATVGKDQIHCDNDQFTLSGNTAPELGAKGVWRYPAIYKGVITITDSTKGNTTVTVPAGNSVPFTWWVTNGVCDSTKATVTLTNYKQPAVATVGKDQIHCNNDQFTLSGNTAPELGAKGVWRYPAIYKGVITITDSTKGNTTVTVPAGNSVPFTWWVTNGVCDSTKATVTLTNYKQPAVATVGKDQIHCNNDQFTLSGNTAPELGAKGVWRYPAIYKGVITITDSTKGNTTVTVPAGNSVPFTWWITNGVCDSTKATVTLTNYKQPAVATVGKDQIHCNNDQFTLSGNTAPELGAKGVWRYPAIYKGVITIADSTKGNTTVTVPAGNSVPFTWWITNGVCDSTKATVTLTNYKQPAVATVGKDQIHCNDDQFTLSGNTAPELGAKGVWRYPAIYKGVITITDSTKGNTTVTVPAGNSVPFTWWVTNGVCDSTKATVTLTNYKQPAVATVGKDQFHCDNDQFTLSGNTAPELGAKGVWRYPAIYKGIITITDSTKGNTTVTVPAGNSVPFTWWVTNGVCDSTKATVTLTNYKQPAVATVGKDQFHCNNDQFTLSGNTAPELGAKGVWRYPAIYKGIITIADSTKGNTTVTVPAGNSVPFTWWVTNGVCDSTKATVTLTNYKQPAVATVGKDQFHCNNDQFTLSGNTAPELGAKGVWRYPAIYKGIITIADSTKGNTTVTVPAGNSVPFTWWVTNGVCDSTKATVTLTNYKQPAVATVGKDQFHCNNDQFTLSGNTAPELGAKGVWRYPAIYKGVITIADSTRGNTTVTVPAGNSVPFTWWITNGVCDSTKATVNITNYKQPAIATVGKDQFHCDDDQFTLSGNTPPELGAKGVWRYPVAYKNVIKIVDSTKANTTVTVPAGNSVPFTWWVTNGVCDSTKATVTLTNYKQPAVATVGKDQFHCDNDQFTLSGNTPSELGAKGVWRYPAIYKNVIIIADSTKPNTTVKVPAGNSVPFTWWITNGVCDSTKATVNITNYKQPAVATVGKDQFHCDNDQFTLSGNTPPELGAKGVWRYPAAFKNVISITDSTKANTTVTVPAGNTVPFTWWVTNGVCDSTSATVKLTNYKQPAIATVGKDQSHCDDSLFTLSGNTPSEYGAKGVWRYPAAFKNIITIADSTRPNTTVIVPAGNTVPFTWWITNGLCDSTKATVNITNYATAAHANAGPDQKICNNTGDFIMQANAPGVPTAKGTWTDISRIPGRATIKSPNSPTTAVTVPVGDTVVLQWAIANGVCDTTFSRVTIINYKAAITANAGPDQEKCNTTADFVMKASDPGSSSATGVWEDISRIPGRATIKSPNDPLTNVTVPIGDTVILKWTVANGTCTSSSSIVTLINYKKADDADAGADIEMCNNTGDFTMAATAPSVPSARGFWSIIKGNAVIKSINSPTSKVNVNVGDTVTLRWTVTNGVCSATWDDVTLINYRLPVAANAGPDQEHCDDATFKMNASDPGVAGAKGTWIVTSNNAAVINISNINQKDATVTVPAGETAQLTWVVSNGVCDASSSSVTLINRKPILGNTIQEDQTVCLTETPMAIRGIALSGGNGTYTYQWQQSTAGAAGPFTNINGANSDSYQPGVLTANTWYRRIVASGACINNISNAVKITVMTIRPIVTSTPAAITTECEKGKDYTTLFGTPVFSHTPYDNETLTVTYNDVTVVTSPCLSNITRTWTATDRCGLSVSASQTITIQDTKAPVFTTPAPADITVDCDKVPAKTDLTANDDCAGEIIIPVVEVRQDIPGSCANSYLLIRTWTAKDACNTGVTLKQVITVKDMTAPVFNMITPADTTVDCDKVPAGFNLTANDNCTPGVINVVPKDSVVHNPRNCNNNYLIYRKWTAFDECGNASAVQQIITVQDTVKPVFNMSAPKDTVVDCDKVPGWPVITATDNCTGNVQVFTNSKTVKLPGNCAGNYQETRTWTVTDECGNKSTMQQIITVQDTTKPVFTVKPPADTMVSCDKIPAPSMGVAVTDNCSTIGNGLTVSLRVTTFRSPDECAGNYRIIRTWTAKDACGNTTIMTQTVTVKDTTKPVIMPAPADVVIFCQDKIPAPPVLTATDNCDNTFPKRAIYTEDPYVADICNGYTIVRRWSIMDACGNKANDVIQRVIINPCQKPQLEATLPSNCSDNGRIALRKVGNVYLPTYTLVSVTPSNAVTGLPRTQSNNVFNLNGATSASFIITDGRTGCSSDTMTYDLSYIQKPMVNLGNDTTICGGNSLVLDAGPANFAYQIKWSTGATTQRININQAGTYWVNVSNGECATTDTIHVGLVPTPLVDIPDTTICRGQSVKLDAYVNGAQYLWSNGSTTSSILVGTQEQFWVKVIKSGCITIDTVNVSVNPPPDISLSRDTAICPDQSIMLTVNSNGGRIKWQTGETSNSIVVNQPGGYWVAVSRDNCVVRDTVNVRLKPSINLDLGPDRNICPGGSITLDGTNPDAISYLWNDGDPNPVKQITQAGKYKLAVMDRFCQRVFMDSVKVNITGLPVINLGRDTTLCKGETLILRAEGGGITGVRWDNGSAGPSLTVTNGGTYKVTVFNDCGSATDDITVDFVQCEPKPTVPNAFSPNGDGRNDVFRPVVRGQMFDYELRIFNRWGELIFMTSDDHRGWDGKYKGVPVDIGTYVWWLNYKKVAGGTSNVLKGEVTVVR